MLKNIAVIVLLGTVVQILGSPLLDNRIAGGKRAAQGQFPFQVSLQASWGHTCGGSLVAPNIVLTAAHCVDPDVKVAGAGGLNNLVLPQKRYIKEQIVHPNFTLNAENDVAIIILEEKFEYSESVQPISLETEEIDGDVSCVAIGWGWTLNGRTNFLHYAVSQTVDIQKCKSINKNTKFPVLNTNVCALMKRGVGVCMGDSGGALISNGRQIGIASWAYSCGDYRPGVFARVSSFVGWITEHIEKYAEY